MRIAILGATSQIARDLIISLSGSSDDYLYLFARRTDEVARWLAANNLPDRCVPLDFSAFADAQFDAVINFIGASDPARLAKMGKDIIGVTTHFDEMVLAYLCLHPDCRYIFLSSGAVYGSHFEAPVTADTPAIIPINALSASDWYGVSKLMAECRHRALPEHAIIDIRVFNYFSRNQDVDARLLISDILRAIRTGTMLNTTPDNVVRDYLHPSDFAGLVRALLAAPPVNTGVDCYSRAPIDKTGLLTAMQERFGLKFEVADARASVNATGHKPNYYSLNRRAADFGYQPRWSSLETILGESAILLANQSGSFQR